MTTPTTPVDMTKEPPAGSALPPVPPAPPDSTLRKRSRSAVARSAARDRTLVIVIGLVLLAAGTLVALLSFGVFGAARASRPLLDPVVVDVMRAQPEVWRIVAIAVGLLLVVLGLVWAARSVRPERRPDLVVDGGPNTAIVVSSSAAADAVAAQAGGLPGVRRARARLVGGESTPALRVTVWLADDANVRDVLARLHDDVLVTARRSLGLDALPAAVRVELDSSPPTSRVA